MGGSRSGGRLANRLRAEGFGGTLEPDASLSAHTTWRIGGPAELLATPRDRDDLILAVAWAARKGIAWRVLGNGSNLLVADDGVGGVVLHVRKVLDEMRRDGDRLQVGSGTSLPAVARWSASLGLAGLEFGTGIPGTVGGALVMNAGWHEHEIGNFVEQVEFLEPDGLVQELAGDQCGFGYRTSRFRQRRAVLLGARLRLRPEAPELIASRLAAFAASRKKNQPTEWPSCGSVFLQPEGDFAGRLIDQAGLKGERVGGIEVSRKHANFFVNLGGGKAADVLRLVERVERVVEEKFGVCLRREFELWSE